jgi:predicted peptidase
MIPWPNQPGLYGMRLPNSKQHFTLLLPDTPGDQPSALIMILHWSGPATPYFGKSILIGLAAPALQDLRALIVAPDCMHTRWNNPESETDVLTLLSHLSEHYEIAVSKTLIMGYSMGAQGVWYLTARNPNRFAAGIVMAGPPPDKYQEPWQTPMYVIHSYDDEHFPFEITADVIQEMQAQSAPIEFVPISGVTHFDAGGFVEPLRKATPWIQQIWLTKGELP